jgi:hypothetical protein
LVELVDTIEDDPSRDRGTTSLAPPWFETVAGATSSTSVGTARCRL